MPSGEQCLLSQEKKNELIFDTYKNVEYTERTHPSPVQLLGRENKKLCFENETTY